MNILNIINKDKSTIDVIISNIIYKVLNIIFTTNDTFCI